VGGADGDIGGVGGLGVGPTLNIADNVRWKSLSGALLPRKYPLCSELLIGKTGGDGGYWVEPGGNVGMGKAPTGISLARYITLDSVDGSTTTQQTYFFFSAH
jgi:hypothetical protein